MSAIKEFLYEAQEILAKKNPLDGVTNVLVAYYEEMGEEVDEEFFEELEETASQILRKSDKELTVAGYLLSIEEIKNGTF